MRRSGRIGRLEEGDNWINVTGGSAKVIFLRAFPGCVAVASLGCLACTDSPAQTRLHIVETLRLPSLTLD